MCGGLDGARPSFVAGSLQLVVFVPTAAWKKCLDASGESGWFANPFVVEAKDREQFRVVPLESSVGFEEALRSARFHAQCVGLVHMSRGFGLRVRPADFDALLTVVRPQDAVRFAGDTWDIAGLPLSMSAESVVEFVAPWPVVPVASVRRGLTRTWVCRATVAPTEEILQHDFGIADISKSKAPKPRPPPARMVMTRMEPRAWPQPAPVPAAVPVPPVVAAGAAATAAASAASASPAALQTLAIGPAQQGPVGQVVDWAALISSAVAQAMEPMNQKLSALQNELVAVKSSFTYAPDSEDDGMVGKEDGPPPAAQRQRIAR